MGKYYLNLSLLISFLLALAATFELELASKLGVGFLPSLIFSWAVIWLALFLLASLAFLLTTTFACSKEDRALRDWLDKNFG